MIKDLRNKNLEYNTGLTYVYFSELAKEKQKSQFDVNSIVVYETFFND